MIGPGEIDIGDGVFVDRKGFVVTAYMATASEGWRVGDLVQLYGGDISLWPKPRMAQMEWLDFCAAVRTSPQSMASIFRAIRKGR